jgi:DNA-binding beta-propeller fold protein YncE
MDMTSKKVLLAIGVAGVWVTGVVQASGQAIDLPTSKEIVRPVPGSPQRLNSLPMSMAVSPDGRYVVTVNAGYGTFESNYEQSLAVMDTTTGVVRDFPDDRTAARKAKQTLYSGLAFSGDGRHVYASMGSETDPVGIKDGDTGNGVVVYGFHEGTISREGFLRIPLQQLAAGRKTMLIGGLAGDKGVPFPAAIAVMGKMGAEKLLVADNLSDDVLLMDAGTGAIERRFDLSESAAVPSTYPVALAVAKDGARAYVGLWNASEVVELDLKKGTVGRRLALLKPSDPVRPGSHPCALEISPDGRTMYVALANRDAVAAVNVGGEQFGLKGYFDTRLPHQTYFGAEPEALAMTPDGSRLYVANAITDAVVVLDPARLKAKAARQGMVEPVGFLPTEWMPMAMSYTGGKLYVATAKGKGTGPNGFPQRQTEEMKVEGKKPNPSTYIATLLYGSLAVLDAKGMEQELPRWTAEVVESNRMKAAEERIEFAPAVVANVKAGASSAAKDDKGSFPGPIKHVIYIIKENRTYDQILGDLERDGKPVGNGDASLTMYGEAVTPNQHELALQFGVLDNFYDSGEVSGDGHVWSTAGIGTDYLEKTWQQDYRGGERTYDFEGVVAEGYPLLQKISDVNEPQSGYLWGNMDRHGRTHYNFGEYVSSTFCDVKKSGSSQEGPLLEGLKCARPTVKEGEQFPAEWGGGVSKWPWAIPLLAKNQATKPELVGHFAPEAPDFNLKVPDQIRATVMLRHLKGWIADRAAGKDTMPNFIVMHVGDDHTAGTTVGGPTPKSSVADNDLAIGRMVDAVSHSAYWDDTAFFILEDDAQNGADHVDAHRSLALVVSKYSPRAKDGGTFVDSRFYSTVSVIRTIETLLGVPPMNNNDAFSSMMGTMFAGPGDQAAFTADYTNEKNGLIYMANAKTAPGAKESSKMDFIHEDQADPQKLNVILWKDAMGDKPVPAMLMVPRKKSKKDDDD